MSDQGNAYRLTNETAKHCQAFMQARADRMRWGDEGKYREAQEEAYALSHPVPTAQEMLIAILQHVGVAVGHGDEADFRAAVMAVAAEMGLNIDEEQGDA